MPDIVKGDLLVCRNGLVKGNLDVDGNVNIGKKGSPVKLQVNGRMNVRNKAVFHSLPIMSKVPYKNHHLVNKEYVDSKLGDFNVHLNNLTDGLTTGGNNFIIDESILHKNNEWTGTNNYNKYLPTSSLNPSAPNDLVTKEYVDGLFLENISLLGTNNVWTGSNQFNILPTGSGLVTLNNHLVTKEYVDNAISVNMNNTSAITVSPGSANNYLTFVTGTSGRQSLYVDTGIMYNATTDTLTVVNATISGNLDATVLNATNAGNINVTGTSSTNNVCSLLMVGNQSTGNQPVFIDTGLTYNANTDTLTVSAVNGNLNGTATNATNVYVRDTSSTDTMCSILLVGDQAVGNQQPFIDGGLTYNANTDNLRASSFTGNLLGDVTGGVSATSLKVGADNGTLIRQVLLGEGVLKSADGGTNEINVGTIGITTSSKIFVTFKLSPAGISWYYVTPGTDRFIITASGAPVNDATFNWVAYN